MNTDSTFMIGNSHSICEDYAIHNDDSIVLCDGCSSSKNTDVGARLLALTALSYLKKYDGENTSLLVESIVQKIKDIKLNSIFYNLDSTMFDATLLMAKIFDDKIKVVLIGDGNIIVKSFPDNIYIHTYSFSNNMPNYLSYQLNDERRRLFTATKPILFCETHLIQPNGIIRKTGIFSQHVSSYKVAEFPIEDCEWVLIVSDGLQSFQNLSGKMSVNHTHVLKQLTKFKTFTGDFVKRRLNRFKKECAKTFNWSHYDDLSVAGIHIDI